MVIWPPPSLAGAAVVAAGHSATLLEQNCSADCSPSLSLSFSTAELIASANIAYVAALLSSNGETSPLSRFMVAAAAAVAVVARTTATGSRLTS